jgi:flagellin
MESARDDYNCHQGDERVSLYINTNLAAMGAADNLVNTDNELSTATEDLSSGLRINTAADDAAGYTISQNLTGQMNGVGQASQNTQDAVSLVQTADGSLSEVEQMLQQIRTLAVEYNNGTLSSTDQAAIVTEVNQLTSEIERIGTTAQFNGIYLLNAVQTITFQVGANDGEVIAVSTISLGQAVGGTFSLGSSTAIASIDAAINAVAGQDDTLGAVQNRLQYTMDDLSTYEENLTAANSAIVDVNMASEMTTFTNLQILQKSGTAVLAQANQLPQNILSLIQNG